MTGPAARTRQLRVCFFGTYRAEYTRNKLTVLGLQQSGAQVIICHQPLWGGFDDRVDVASGGWYKPRFWGRALKAYWNLIRDYSSIGDYDVMMVGYPGHFDVYLGRILTWLRRRPLAWEVVISLYLIMLERGLAKKHRFSTTLLRLIERQAARLPDMVFLDSSDFIKWFQKIHHAPVEKFRILPVSVDSNEFLPYPFDSQPEFKNQAANFCVLYYGSYIPNHGVATIVEAAYLLRSDSSIEFEMIGEGPDRYLAEALVKQYGLKNVTFIDWLEKEQLANYLAQAGVCLGSFGDTLQASLTNNNKILEAFSVKIPVITGASPALPPEMVDGIHLILCQRGDPAALAEAILRLRGNPDLCNSLRENGFILLQQRFDVSVVGNLLTDHLLELISGKMD